MTKIAANAVVIVLIVRVVNARQVIVLIVVHVVPVMKAGKTATGTPYLVMECLEGLDLADLIARDGPSATTGLSVACAASPPTAPRSGCR